MYLNSTLAELIVGERRGALERAACRRLLTRPERLRKSRGAFRDRG